MKYLYNLILVIIKSETVTRTGLGTVLCLSIWNSLKNLGRQKHISKPSFLESRSQRGYLCINSLAWTVSSLISFTLINLEISLGNDF